MSYPEGLWHPSVPGLDCIARGHISTDWIEQEGAFSTEEGEIPTASWCLWCGTAVSNEKLPQEPS